MSIEKKEKRWTVSLNLISIQFKLRWNIDLEREREKKIFLVERQFASVRIELKQIFIENAEKREEFF